MTAFNPENNKNDLPSLFVDCENAYHLIEEGNEMQAEKMFPLEYYLIKKYLYADYNSLFKLLEERLTISEG